MVALRAEYGVEAEVRWHIVPDTDTSRSLCHRLLSPIAELRPLSGTADGIEAEHLCQLCRAAFESGTEPSDGRDADAPEPD